MQRAASSSWPILERSSEKSDGHGELANDPTRLNAGGVPASSSRQAGELGLVGCWCGMEQLAVGSEIGSWSW